MGNYGTVAISMKVFFAGLEMVVLKCFKYNCSWILVGLMILMGNIMDEIPELYRWENHGSKW